MTIRARALRCAIMLAAIAAASGCGDSEKTGSAPGVEEISPATEPVRVSVQRVAKLLETTRRRSECRELHEFNARSLVRFQCPPPRPLARSMARFRIVGAEHHGTGAIVDYKSGDLEEGAAIVLFVAPDRNWGISRFGVVTRPSVGTSDARSRARFADVVGTYLEAVRERDCDSFAKVAYSEGATGRTVCRTTFAETRGLAKRLRANPAARPSYEGGNAAYGFFSLETSRPEPERSTISVVRGASDGQSGYVVLDIASSPTAADQRRAVKRFREGAASDDFPDRD